MFVMDIVTHIRVGGEGILKSPILSFGMFFFFSARGPYGGQQWRKQNATPPSDHVVTSLAPPKPLSPP